MSHSSTPQNTAASAGPLVLGSLFNWGLYGALSVQVYLYFLAFPRDRPAMKRLVFGLYIVETLQTILVTHDAFKTFGVDYGNAAALDKLLLSGLSVPILSGIVSGAVQFFFAYRIFALSKSKVLASVICVIALTQGGSGIAEGVQGLQLGLWSKLQTDAFVSCTIWLTGAAVCDIVIAVSLTYCLSKSKSEFKPTQALVSRLIRLAIETGSLTAAVATIAIALFLAFPHNVYHATPALILAKIYSNTLMVTLNSRLCIADGRITTPAIDLGSSSFPSAWMDRKTHIKTLWHQKNQGQARQDLTTLPIEVTVDVQHNNWGPSYSLNNSDTYTNRSEGIKAATFVDDATDRKANPTGAD